MLEKLFSPKGRVTRLQNLGYELLVFVSMWVVGTVFSFAVFGTMYLVGVYNKSFAFGSEGMSLPSESELLIIFLLPILVAIYSNIIIKIKRLHDMNLSGWWLPIFSLLAIPYIALYFWPGTKGKNRFDEDNDKTINNSNPSLTKAVYTHAKDIAAEAKPTISEYKQKHATSQTQAENQDIDSEDEDAIYEQVMNENKIDKNINGAINKIDKVIDDSVKQVKTSKYITKGLRILKILFLVAVVLGTVIAIANFGYKEYKHQQWISSEKYKTLKKKCDSGDCTRSDRLELLIGDQYK